MAITNGHINFPIYWTGTYLVQKILNMLKILNGCIMQHVGADLVILTVDKTQLPQNLKNIPFYNENSLESCL